LGTEHSLPALLGQPEVIRWSAAEILHQERGVIGWRGYQHCGGTVRSDALGCFRSAGRQDVFSWMRLPLSSWGLAIFRTDVISQVIPLAVIPNGMRMLSSMKRSNDFHDFPVISPTIACR
jgi:hypothetical protein